MKRQIFAGTVIFALCVSTLGISVAVAEEITGEEAEEVERDDGQAMIAPAETEQEPRLVWVCSDPSTGEEELFLVGWGDRSYVKLYDERLWGIKYEVDDGTRWDFDATASGYTRSVILSPGEDSARYYEFERGEVSGSYDYLCRPAR